MTSCLFHKGMSQGCRLSASVHKRYLGSKQTTMSIRRAISYIGPAAYKLVFAEFQVIESFEFYKDAHAWYIKDIYAKGENDTFPTY